MDRSGSSPLLGLAWRSVGGVSAAKAQHVARDRQVDVFGEAIDESSRLGERGSAFERQVLTAFRQLKELAKHQADPEVFFYTCGRKPARGSRLLECEFTLSGQKREKIFHLRCRPFGELAHDLSNPCRRERHIVKQLGAVVGC